MPLPLAGSFRLAPAFCSPHRGQSDLSTCKPDHPPSLKHFHCPQDKIHAESTSLSCLTLLNLILPCLCPQSPPSSSHGPWSLSGGAFPYTGPPPRLPHAALSLPGQLLLTFRSQLESPCQGGLPDLPFASGMKASCRAYSLPPGPTSGVSSVLASLHTG